MPYSRASVRVVCLQGVWQGHASTVAACMQVSWVTYRLRMLSRTLSFILGTRQGLEEYLRLYLGLLSVAWAVLWTVKHVCNIYMWWRHGDGGAHPDLAPRQLGQGCMLVLCDTTCFLCVSHRRVLGSRDRPNRTIHVFPGVIVVSVYQC